MIKTYEERPAFRADNILDKNTKGAPMVYTTEMVARGRRLFILNLSAEA